MIVSVRRKVCRRTAAQATTILLTWLAIAPIVAQAAPTASLLGDANCDGLATPEDLRHLEREFNDDDGDAAASADGGAVVSCSGADANGDGVISAADLVAITRRLYGSTEGDGPRITFIGIASASGTTAVPLSEFPVRLFQVISGIGFRLVIEAAPGLSGLPVAQDTFNSDPLNPFVRPDLQVEVSRGLGDGNLTVCGEGGVAPIAPPHYGDEQAVANALNDLGCRFDVAGNPAISCTVDEFGSPEFVDPRSRVQFCLPVSSLEAFPDGLTVITARALDIGGNPGPITQMVLRVGDEPLATPTPRSTATPQPSETVTDTPTEGPSPTATDVVVPPTVTATALETATGTVLPSSTATVTRTGTRTRTHTFGPSPTRTRTSTHTRVPTRTATGQRTATATRTRLSTATPTNTRLRTPTMTTTPGATSTRTRTPPIGTRTSTPTRTVTGQIGTRTGTPTRTHTVQIGTRTRTSTPTRTATGERPPTRTSTGTRTRTRTRTPTLIGTPTNTGTPTRTGTVTRTPTRTRTGTVTRTRSITRTPTNTGTPTRTGTVTRTPTITRTPSITGTPTATPRPGAEITYVGLARANDTVIEPVGMTSQGWPIYERSLGYLFNIVVEAKPGPSRRRVGLSTFNSSSGNPSVRPDFEIIVSRPLGDGSALVCDDMPPQIGGVPASENFNETQPISNAINDFGCRFVDGSGRPSGRGQDEACTMFEDGMSHFVVSMGANASTAQFCSLIAEPFAFPEGDTVVTVRVRDVTGEVGAPRSFVVRIAP